MPIPTIFRCMSVIALVVACLSCAALPVQGEFFDKGFDGREPRRTILVIFNHGYSATRATTFTATFPPILRTAVEQNRDVALFSQVRNTASLQSGDHRHFIESAVAFFHNTHHVPLENIILAGQSCGGWGALETAAFTYPQIGGVIAFAPTCHGQLFQQSSWTETRRSQAIGELAGLLRPPALIFVYEGDSYYRLADWKVFESRTKESPQLRLVKLDKDTVLKACPRCTQDSHGAAHAREFAAAYFQTHVQAFIESVRANSNGRAKGN